MELSKRDRDTLERLEEELWREETRFDIERMKQVIVPDFFELGRSGRTYTRQDILVAPRQAIDAVALFLVSRDSRLTGNVPGESTRLARAAATRP